MAEVDIMQEKTEKVKVGRAYTYNAELLLPYADAVEKFLRDAPETLRFDKRWLDVVTTNLLRFKKNQDGGIIHSSALMNSFFSQRVLNQQPQGRNLITGRQLLNLGKQTSNKNPFGLVYIDTGVALKTVGDSYNPNNLIAKILAQDLEARGIEIGKGVVPDFYMLNVECNQDSDYGLVLRLNNLITQEDLAHADEFPWRWKREEGVALAFLSGRDWSSGVGHLGCSDAGGRVVGYDTEGVAKKSLEVPKHAKSNTTSFDDALKKVRAYKKNI